MKSGQNLLCLQQSGRTIGGRHCASGHGGDLGAGRAQLGALPLGRGLLRQARIEQGQRRGPAAALTEQLGEIVAGDHQFRMPAEQVGEHRLGAGPVAGGIAALPSPTRAQALSGQRATAAAKAATSTGGGATPSMSVTARR